jgi:integrase
VAWGYVAMDGAKQVRCFKSEWTRDDAEQALAAFQLKIDQPTAQAPGITFQQAADRYLAMKARKKTVSNDTRHLAEFVAVFGGGTSLADITSSKISAWKAAKLAATCPMTGEPYAAATINRPLATLRHLLFLARDEWEVLTAVPKIRQEREPQGRLRWLTQEEIGALLAACDRSTSRELRHGVVLALNTGLRLAELYGLTWDRVDLSRSVIRLELTKSGRRREVPINADALAALSSLGPRSEGRVFKVRDPRQSYRHAVRRAKLDDVTFHTLRHTFASWAMMRGASLKELQELLGHASLTMTMRYAHLAPERLKQAVSRLDGLTSGVQPSPLRLVVGQNHASDSA